MAFAAFTLLKCTGASGVTETDCDHDPSFLSADVTTSDPTAYPIKAPLTSGSAATYSYECVVRLSCSTAPDTQCQNFTVWGPDQRPDHPTNKLTILVGATSSGISASESASSIATTSVHDNYYDSSHTLALGVEPGDGMINATGEKSDYLVAQLKVEWGAGMASMSEQVFNYYWEES